MSRGIPEPTSATRPTFAHGCRPCRASSEWRSRPAFRPRTKRRTARALAGRADGLVTAAKPLIDEETALLQRRVALTQAADEVGAFARLAVPLSDMQGLSYLAVRLGSVAPEKVPEIVQVLGSRAVVVALEKPGYLMAVSSRKGRWALDSELARHEFQAAQFPLDRTGVPADMLAGLQRDRESVERSLAASQGSKAALRARNEAEIRQLLAHLQLSVDDRFGEAEPRLLGKRSESHRLDSPSSAERRDSGPGIPRRRQDCREGFRSRRSFRR